MVFVNLTPQLGFALYVIGKLIMEHSVLVWLYGFTRQLQQNWH